MERRPQFPRNLKGPGYQRNNERSGRGSGEGRGFRGDRGRGDRGRGGGRSEGRTFTGGRGENRSNENRGEGEWPNLPHGGCPLQTHQRSVLSLALGALVVSSE